MIPAVGELNFFLYFRTYIEKKIINSRTFLKQSIEKDYFILRILFIYYVARVDVRDQNLTKSWPPSLDSSRDIKISRCRAPRPHYAWATPPLHSGHASTTLGPRLTTLGLHPHYARLTRPLRSGHTPRGRFQIVELYVLPYPIRNRLSFRSSGEINEIKKQSSHLSWCIGGKQPSNV